MHFKLLLAAGLAGLQFATALPSLPSHLDPRGNSYQNTVIKNHNIHRKNNSAPEIVWSSSLAATAKKIANTCVFAHSMDVNGGGYGQNIAAGASDVSKVVSNQWYNNEVTAFGDQYGNPTPTGFSTWGHFSQVVWKKSGQVGCFTAYCPKGLKNTGQNVPPYFTVCNYSPPGNVKGQYAANIGAPLDMPTYPPPS